ncbi:hypothetical protein [Cupriavidus taiwanensis]|uniref:hypothetical protein n=1 Tax=Cupriavidus taiwanensis TaxID=164546 RepID=UPI000E1329B2|nr:hypothetical protein [Cupriavidus taiwanensis]SOZ97315.1 hypothetical protein CBM2598_U70007 [Cupriavidus taiwanensis]
MTPDQVAALSGLVESLAWLAVLSGVIGGALFAAASKFVTWAMDALVSRQFSDYRVAAMFQRQQERKDAAVRRSQGVKSV